MCLKSQVRLSRIIVLVDQRSRWPRSYITGYLINIMAVWAYFQNKSSGERPRIQFEPLIIQYVHIVFTYLNDRENRNLSATTTETDDDAITMTVENRDHRVYILYSVCVFVIAGQWLNDRVCILYRFTYDDVPTSRNANNIIDTYVYIIMHYTPYILYGYTALRQNRTNYLSYTYTRFKHFIYT